MTDTTTAPESVRRTVDDYLGPGEKRFFGDGYKRAVQTLGDIVLDVGPDGAGSVRARASVRYPEDWSRKGRRNQAPHLSSIDVLLLAGEVAEVYLTHALGLDARSRSEMRLRKVRMKAGTSPVEEALDGFEVRAAITSLPPQAHTARRVSVADCQVGALRVRCEIEHPAGTVRPGTGGYHGPDDLLGPAELRPFRAAHKTKSQLIQDLRVDLGELSARATVGSRSSAPAALTVQGLESYSHPATSILDVFVCAIQLGQILLYELDGVPRSESNTLWMRQSVLTIADTARPVTSPAPLSVRLAEPQLLTTREGDTWRSVEIAGELQHMSVTCSAAHRLP
ncbi:AvrD family protein [Streptomyces sp. 351MFTsu5.1]|uniref:AvrD family protein n=1 Tax=Streptomyces sp. 351MFTsu5.1 TaxID=1172180 RepID=UPI00037C6701|nr:AvrD family protein [Streptomyces sp. 351MFTsu5.1]